MRWLICAFVVLIWHKQVFSWRGSIIEFLLKIYCNDPKFLDRYSWANSRPRSDCSLLLLQELSDQSLWANIVDAHQDLHCLPFPLHLLDALLPELFCLLLDPPGFNCWFSFAPVFQCCWSTPQGSPGVGRNTFLSSPHLCFIIVFICDLFVSRDDPLMSWKTFKRTEQLYVLSHDRSRGQG